MTFDGRSFARIWAANSSPARELSCPVKDLRLQLAGQGLWNGIHSVRARGYNSSSFTISVIDARAFRTRARPSPKWVSSPNLPR